MNYEQSTYFNPHAAPNRITDNRPAEFRDDDAEQVAYLAQYKIDHPNGDHFGVYAVLTICTIVGILLYFRACTNKPEIILNMTPCERCHVQENPAIKNLAQYRRIHQNKPVAKDKEAIEELKRQEYIMSVITGGKP